MAAPSPAPTPALSLSSFGARSHGSRAVLIRLAAIAQMPVTLGVLAGAAMAPLRIVALLAIVTSFLVWGWSLRAARPPRGAKGLRGNRPSRIYAPGSGAGTASRDRLTGTLTREGLVAALETGGPVPGVLAVIDVTGLGEVNRRDGVERGDALMREVAALLASALRPGDLLARWGGDEFVVCLAGMHRRESAGVARRLAETMRTAPPSRFGRHLDGGIAVTVGVAAFEGVAGAPLSTAVREAEEEIHEARLMRGRRVA